MTNERKQKIRYALLVVLCLAVTFLPTVTAQSSPAAVPSSTFASLIDRITEGKNSRERGEVIYSELKKLNIRVSTEGFLQNGEGGNDIEGKNIFAEIPPNTSVNTADTPAGNGTKRVVMFGAHYDRWIKGSGAIDNASGCAALIEILRIFREHPPKNFTLKAAFWDLEEAGLVGSKTFVKNHSNGGLPQIYINFDVFGSGDSIWLWATNEKSEFAALFATAAKTSKTSFLISSKYPPSDHLSFAVPGVEAFSFSLLPAGEAENIIRVISGEKIEYKDYPEVLRTIHTERDTKERIDTKAVIKAISVIETAVRGLDAQRK